MPYIGDDYSIENENKSEAQFNFRRVGKFTLSVNLVHTCPRMVLALMSKLIIIRCEYDYATQQFSYTGYSELFEEREPGIETDKYLACIEDGKIVMMKENDD